MDGGVEDDEEDDVDKDGDGHLDDDADEGAFAGGLRSQGGLVLPYEVQDQSDDGEEETQDREPPAGRVVHSIRLGWVRLSDGVRPAATFGSPCTYG